MKNKRVLPIICLAAVLILVLCLAIPRNGSKEAGSYETNGIYIFARDNELPEKDAAETVITMRIPKGQSHEKVLLTDVHNKKLGSYKLSELTATDIGNHYEYELPVKIPKAGGKETAVKITAEVDGKKTLPITLYREVRVGEQEMMTMCDVLQSVGDYADSLEYDLTTEEGVKNARQKVLKYLQGQPDVQKTWIDDDNGYVVFITKDNLVAAIEINLLITDPDEATMGSGVTTDIFKLKSEMEFDPDYHGAMYEPDVLVCCPVRSVDTITGGYAHEDIGKKLADKYGGNCYVATDEDGLDIPLYSLASYNIEKYGTVILCDHGGAFHRSNGTYTVVFEFFAQKKKNRETVYDYWTDMRDSSDLVYADEFYNYIDYDSDDSFDHLKMMFVYDEDQRKYYISISTNYLMEQWDTCQFPNTLFYLGACHSYCDSDFNQFLVDHGAGGVIGYWDTVKTRIDKRNVKEYFENLMKTSEKDVLRNNNLGESVDDSSMHCGTDITVLYAKNDIVTGYVTDSEKKPIEGVTVHAYRYYNNFLQEEYNTTTNKNGEYSMKNLPWGMYLYQAEDGNQEVFLTSCAQEVDKLPDLILDTATVEIVVHGKKKYMQDAVVTLIDMNNELTVPKLTKNNKGKSVYAAECISPAKYQITIACEKYETVQQTIEIPAGESSFEFKLKSRKGTPEDTMLRLERAQNEMDQEALLDCYAPQYSSLYDGMLGLMDGLVDFPISSILDIGYGLSDFYDMAGILPVIHYEIDDIQYASDKETCIVYAISYITFDGKTTVDNIEIPMQLYDDEWLVSMENDDSLMSIFGY